MKEKINNNVRRVRIYSQNNNDKWTISEIGNETYASFAYSKEDLYKK